MGAQESRRVTVDNSGDDTIGVVKISETLLHDGKQRSESEENVSQEDVKKLWEELSARKKELDEQQEKIDDLLQDAFEQGRNMSENSPSFVDENLRKSLEEKEQELNEIRKKTQLFQDKQLKKSAEIEHEVLKEFNNAVNEMKAKYNDEKVDPVCTSLQNHVMDCYQENKTSSLKCSQLIRDYVTCVEQARKSMAQTLIASS